MFHSDRGFQYTNRVFHHKLQQAGLTQSMSRVAHCIDNGPMEGFWGILKRERYYGKRFTGKQDLVQMIESYIRYYNTRRVQLNLGVLTPMEKRQLSLAA
ncbi:MAG: IS3 family transposase [Oscillospiraceae bacterium]|nr:IS3 family transposase [Oscillospiraceae bacterium]